MDKNGDGKLPLEEFTGPRPPHRPGNGVATPAPAHQTVSPGGR